VSFKSHDAPQPQDKLLLLQQLLLLLLVLLLLLLFDPSIATS